MSFALMPFTRPATPGRKFRPAQLLGSRCDDYHHCSGQSSVFAALRAAASTPGADAGPV